MKEHHKDDGKDLGKTHVYCDGCGVYQERAEACPHCGTKMTDSNVHTNPDDKSGRVQHAKKEEAKA